MFAGTEAQSASRQGPSATTDAELARRLAAGDQSALTEIVRQWQRPLGRYLSRLCGSCHGDRDDVLQEVFLKVYRNINMYDIALPFSAWIYRICRNEGISRMRTFRNTSESELPENVAESIWGTMAALPDAPLCGAETAHEIQAIVAGMPEKLRDVFVLRFFEEKDYSDIGDILRENANTVATRIKRAREWFMEHAKQRGIGPAGTILPGRSRS